jgi:ATP-dependent RNA helicase DDX18/HAS1
VNKKDHFLMSSAVDAYKAYLHSYIANTLKDVFDINKLDLAKVCRSFGLETPPMVHLNLSIMPSNRRKKMNKGEKGYYQKGLEKKGDGRQFTY